LGKAGFAGFSGFGLFHFVIFERENMRNAGTEESLKLKRTVHICCPECKKMVFLVWNNGGSVWVDELGWPWEKHECFNRESKVPDAQLPATPIYEEYDRIARFSKPCEFCSATIKFSRYAAHTEHCSQRGKSGTFVSLLGERGAFES
jgi:hypothetical protein